ncbi:MAG TPA: hypothetical protein VHF89_12215, partial [Solirubrobacteraceae bacterium]|nr:hypothetical protein [Solirubrobacteraceae bacterium]
MPLRPPRPLAGLVVVLASLALPAGAGASDGTYTQVLCANPDTGRGVVPENGRLPDGTTNPWNVQYAGVSAGWSRCTGIIGGDDGVPVSTGGGWSSGDANRGGALRYRAPESLVFRGGVIYRYGTMSGRFSWTLTRNGRWDHIFGQPFDERCSWGEGCSSRGTPAAPWSEANRVRIGSNEINGFDLSVLCDIPQGWSCSADGSQTVRVYGGRLALEDTSAPVPGAASGSLVTAETLVGPAEVDFSATDSGSGLYRARLLVDGVPRLARPVHENGGRCIDVNAGNADPYEFAHVQPCRPSASTTATFDTRQLRDGRANVRVVVEDAGGNPATLVNRTVTIDNVPPPSSLRPPAVDGMARRGSGLALSAGAWDDHGAEGSPTIAHRWQRCAADGSGCADVPGAGGPTYVLGAEDVGRRLRVVEIASNREGSSQAASALTAVVTLEDGTLPPDRDGIDNDGDGDVDEPGETPPGGGSGGGGSGGGGSGGSGSGGQTDNPSGVSGTRLPVPGGAGGGGARGSEASASDPGSVNGEGASPRARLTVAFAGRTGTSRTVPFGRGAAITGRLVDEHGRPIRNAIVDVSATAAVRGAAAVPAQPAVTGGDGAFTYRVDGRASSRTLRFTYRYLRAGDVVADASLVLKVRARVRLSVRLRGAVVRYSGRVLSGSMPRSGKVVVLQGRVAGGRWQTFASRRASKRSGT